MTSKWLPLADYSMKYKVSVSTLRRKIKSQDIKFQLDDGKYFIMDEQPAHSTHLREQRPSQINSEDSQMMGATAARRMTKADRSDESSFERSSQVPQAPRQASEEPILTAANKLLTDLKRAYTQILQEKEEQVLLLKEEVTDLKTLVKVLEEENSRLKQMQTRF